MLSHAPLWRRQTAIHMLLYIWKSLKGDSTHIDMHRCISTAHGRPPQTKCDTVKAVIKCCVFIAFSCYIQEVFSLMTQPITVKTKVCEWWKRPNPQERWVLLPPTTEEQMKICFQLPSSFSEHRISNKRVHSQLRVPVKHGIIRLIWFISKSEMDINVKCVEWSWSQCWSVLNLHSLVWPLGGDFSWHRSLWETVTSSQLVYCSETLYIFLHYSMTFIIKLWSVQHVIPISLSCSWMQGSQVLKTGKSDISISTP